jgi:hypothetical protein
VRDDSIAKEAWRREASHHAGHRNFRPHLREKGANLMGLRGEEAFSERFGLSLDLTPRLGGDGGRDFGVVLRVANGTARRYEVDCKAALVPKYLIVEQGRVRRETIYVLCRYIPDDDRCKLQGWEWGAMLLKAPTRDFGYGIINHWIPAERLRGLDEIAARLVR